MDQFFQPNSEDSMGDTWLQHATIISLTPCRGFDRSIFLKNVCVKFYDLKCEKMLILHGDGM